MISSQVPSRGEECIHQRLFPGGVYIRLIHR